MVQAYWNIGKIIAQEQNGRDRAEYGEYLLKFLSKKLTDEFGKGFTYANVKNMRQFYITFNNGYALRSQLSWTHYRLLMRIEKDDIRSFYIEECIQNNWSTRQLERQINSFYYERLLAIQKQYKEEVRNEIKSLEPVLSPDDIIKDPYVLEFVNYSPPKRWELLGQYRYCDKFTRAVSKVVPTSIYLLG